jgi:hypothetical protein
MMSQKDIYNFTYHHINYTAEINEKALITESKRLEK